MGHYGSIRGTVYAAAPAGSIFITVYSIWHRRPPSSGHRLRNMLKYIYWRMVLPQRDWIIEPDFDLDDLNDLENASYVAPRPVQEGLRD
jgi:hypothetical protein